MFLPNFLNSLLWVGVLMGKNQSRFKGLLGAVEGSTLDALVSVPGPRPEKFV